MRIEVFLDNGSDPIEVLTPPETFHLNTETLTDGTHELLFRATDKTGDTSTREITFKVQNGPAISVHGIADGETLHGKVDLLANAYGARTGDEFEPQRMETPAPVPTWAWVLFLSICAWGVGYLSLELSNHVDGVMPANLIAASQPVGTNGSVSDDKMGATQTDAPESTGGPDQADWRELGAQVYGINCSSCHQITGKGLPAVFPPLIGNASVVDPDPTSHITTVIKGLSGKVIDGVAYVSPMPAFGALLNDAEIAAVVNHERSQWGNNSAMVTPAQVEKLR